MKIKVLQEDLAKAVSQVSRFVNPRVQLPILGNIIFRASKTKLNLVATNLELSISKELGAEVSEEGEIAVPGKTIFEIVSNLPKGQIQIESQKEQMSIKAEGFKGSVSGMDTADFPKVATSISSKELVELGQTLTDSLSKVLFCASSDETRPVLNGVLLLCRKDELYLVATDGFRLSQKVIKLQKPLEIEKLILPKAVVAELLKSDSTKNLSMQVIQKDGQVVFQAGESILSSRIIAGDFPDFEQIIPKSSTTKVTAQKDELLRVVKLASVFARDNANMVKFEIKKDSLKVSAESSKSGKQEGEVEAKVEGDEMEIIFNFKFLEELLNVIESDEVQIELTNTNAPGVFRDLKDSNFLHLIMPVKIQN